MKSHVLILAAILACIFQACSSTNVTTDYDQEADFTRYKTFGWMQFPNGRTSMPNKPLVRKHIETSVTEALTAKGMQPSDTPDLFIAFHSGVKDKIDVTSWGYRYGRWGGLRGRNIAVHQYKEGTIVIDLIDASTKELVWRGVGKGEVGGGDPAARVKDAVSEILAKYPPEK